VTVNDKTLVHEFWNTASCGEALYLDRSNAAGYARQVETRYRLEPYIRDFARFQDWTGKDVLEIGVGLGADHQSFAEVRISTVLTHGDLLESDVGQRHRGWLLSMAKRIWPRRLLRSVLPGHGLFMLIEARK
jgi:hypothetical protein